MREKIAKIDYEFGAPKSYFDWDKLDNKDKSWYLRKADQILAITGEYEEVKELPVVADGALPDGKWWYKKAQQATRKLCGGKIYRKKEG